MSSLQGKREKYYARKTRKKTFLQAKNEYQNVVSPRQNNITERETENTKYDKTLCRNVTIFYGNN